MFPKIGLLLSELSNIDGAKMVKSNMVVTVVHENARSKAWRCLEQTTKIHGLKHGNAKGVKHEEAWSKV